MTQQKTHDLFDFMQQITTEMAEEYNRVRMRATEDPGTAGDQGEKNWAKLLRDWLPRTYSVVTKGRIINHEGATSPQIDVLVLHGSYPKKLLDKTPYLAAGVAAAFECKITLKASHIAEAVVNCTKIKGLYPSRGGTPYSELHSPLIYGLLAHSHNWKSENSTPEQNIDQKLQEADAVHVSHPRLQLDLLCVADLAAWTSSVSASAPNLITGGMMPPTSGYMRHTHGHRELFTPIGVLIAGLTRRLAWENASLRDLAGYYQIVNHADRGAGHPRWWPSSVLSDEVRHRVESLPPTSKGWWDEWSGLFF
jgi:hypothetical protein